MAAAAEAVNEQEMGQMPMSHQTSMTEKKKEADASLENAKGCASLPRPGCLILNDIIWLDASRETSERKISDPCHRHGQPGRA